MENPNAKKERLYFVFTISTVVLAASVSVLMTRLTLEIFSLSTLILVFVSLICMLAFGFLWVKTPAQT